MKWEKNHIDLGTIKERTSVTINYIYKGDKKITEVIPSCPGCTTANYKVATNKVEVIYNPGKLPKHLAGTFYHVTIKKTITIKYEDDTSDTLSFSGKIIK